MKISSRESLVWRMRPASASDSNLASCNPDFSDTRSPPVLPELPRDLWIWIFRQLTFPYHIRLYPVSAHWRELVRASVTSFEGCEGNWLTDAVLLDYPALQHLNARACDVSEAAICSLAHLTDLTLSQKLCRNDEWLRRLTHLCSLEYTWHESRRKKGLAERVLGVEQIEPVVSDEAPRCGESLVGLTNLTSFTFRGNLGGGDLVGYVPDVVKPLTNLTYLAIGHNALITDAGISGLINLMHLDITAGFGPNISDAAITGLTNLTSLAISNTRISDYGIMGLTKLRALDLTGMSNVRGPGLAALPNLTVLDLTENPFIANDAISALISLTDLNLSGTGRVTDRGVRHLTKLTALRVESEAITDNALILLTNLKILGVMESESITAQGIEGLTSLTELMSFPYDTGSVLTQLPLLRSLDLYGTNWVNADDDLAPLTTLTMLNLGITAVSDRGIAGLVNLTHLVLGHACLVTDAGISGLTNLTYLDKRHCDRISTACVKKLPNLFRFHEKKRFHEYD